MRTMVTIGTHQFPAECNAATPIICKRVFGMNVLSEFQKMNTDEEIDTKLETLGKIIFVFVKTAELGVMECMNLQVNDYVEFLSQFDYLDIADEQLINDITSIWIKNNKSDSLQKNQVSRPQG